MKATAIWGIWTAVAILALASPVVAQEGLRWESDLPTAQKLARQSNRLVLIHFGGPWCGPCRMLEQNVFSQPGFGNELAADYVAVKVDPNVERAVAREYGITRVPTDAIATPSGQLIYRIPSPNTASDYVTTMLRVAAQTRPEHQTTP
ncbi:MAG TPA: thioredoxin family protein, partial [Pirellulales bacterium]|nr:thioredoxin family protein [Pirellulales bacterium]